MQCPGTALSASTAVDTRNGGRGIPEVRIRHAAAAKARAAERMVPGRRGRGGKVVAVLRAFAVRSILRTTEEQTVLIHRLVGLQLMLQLRFPKFTEDGERRGMAHGVY